MKSYRILLISLIWLLLCSGLVQAKQLIWNVGVAGADAYGDADTLTGTFDQMAFTSQTSTIQFDTGDDGILSSGDRFSDAGDLRIRDLLASKIIDKEGLNQVGGYEVTCRWTGVEGYVTGVSFDPTTGDTRTDFRYTSGTLNMYLDTSRDSSFANPAGTSPPAGAGGTGFENGTLIATFAVKDGVGHTFLDFNGGAVANQGSVDLLLEFTYGLDGFWLDATSSPLDFAGTLVKALIDMNIDSPTQSPGIPEGALYTSYSNQDGSILVESEQCLGQLGDYVWLDTNRNGVQDVGEMGIDGVKVLLTDSQGNIKTTTTFTGGPNNLPGFYLFEDLCAGNYTVSIDRPNSPPLVGLFESPVGQGGDYTKDSNDHNGSAVVLPNNNAIDLSIDFGYYSPCNGKIGDYVWLDNNRDGIQNDGATGINGVTVVLEDGSGQQVSTSTFTGGPLDIPGFYQFDGLCQGSYNVKVDDNTLPLGLVPSPMGAGTPETDSDNPVGTPVSLPDDNSTDVTIDFGYNSPCNGRIGDYVWLDSNRDGIQNDGATGINGVTVVLDDGISQQVSTSTFTGGPNNTPGFYIFEGLCAGNYTVRVETDSAPLTGLVVSPTGSGTPATDSNDPTGTDVGLAEDNSEDLTIDFGYNSPCAGMIGDYVWKDLNVNGIQDDDNTGINGVNVWLEDSQGISTPTTTFTGGPNDAPGYYSFGGLCAGSYAVRIDPNSAPLVGWSPSPQGQGTPATDSDNPAGTGVVLSVDDSNDLTIDFGYYQLASIGDYVWEDLNRDGIQDNGEPGIPGVTVNLQDCSGNTIGSTTTDGNGKYLFDNLMPGNYNIKFILPSGYVFSPQDQGGDDALDSDADTTSGLTTCTILESGENDLSWDAGMYVSTVKIDVEKYVKACTIDKPTDPGCDFHHHKHSDGDEHVEDCDYNHDGKCDTKDHDYCGIFPFFCQTYDKYHCDYDKDGDCDATDESICDKNGDGYCNYHDKESCFHHDDDQDGDDSGSSEQCTEWVDADEPTGPVVPLCTVTTSADPGCAFHHHKHSDGDDHVKDCDYNKDGKCDTGDQNYCDKNSYSCGNYDKYHCDYDKDGDCDTADKSICDKNGDGYCNYHDKESCFQHGDQEENEDGNDDGTSSGDSNCSKVYFKFVITNDGAVTLSNITLSDSVYDVSSCQLPASLAPGESYTCEIGPLAPEAGQHTNTAIATGNYIGTEVTDSDDANYFGGTVEVGCVRSPGYWKNHPDAWPVESITIGGLEYTIEQAIGIMDKMDKSCTADKTYTLFQFLVAAKLDVLMGAESGCIDETIAAADEWLIQYPLGSGVKAYSDAWNTGEPLSEKLDQYVNGQLCAAACEGNVSPTTFPTKSRIDIQKYTNGYDADVAPGPYVKVGESVEWKYVVKNTGDIVLSEISVKDDKVGSISCPNTSLASGASMTCSATGIATAGQYVNTGCVEGYTADGIKVSDCDKSHYYGTKTQSGCGTGTSGYWSKHSSAWPLWSVTIGGISYSKDKAMGLISKSGFTDKTYAMFSALVAAKLNVKTGTNSDCISDTINAAETWIKTYSLGCGVRENSSAWASSGKSLYQKLITYNNGLLCAPHRDSITTNYTSWWGTEKKSLVCSDDD